MKVLLDTNVCIAILNGSDARVIDRYKNEGPTTVGLCSVVKAELLFGARKSNQTDRVLGALKQFFEPLPSLTFDDQCAEHYGMIRAHLEGVGTPIGANDLMIAAIARRHDLTLATRNVGEFSRVIGLRVEDWFAPL